MSMQRCQSEPGDGRADGSVEMGEGPSDAAKGSRILTIEPQACASTGAVRRFYEFLGPELLALLPSPKTFAQDLAFAPLFAPLVIVAAGQPKDVASNAKNQRHQAVHHGGG
jgi:hypothetical protein